MDGDASQHVVSKAHSGWLSLDNGVPGQYACATDLHLGLESVSLSARQSSESGRFHSPIMLQKWMERHLSQTGISQLSDHMRFACIGCFASFLSRLLHPIKLRELRVAPFVSGIPLAR